MNAAVDWQGLPPFAPHPVIDDVDTIVDSDGEANEIEEDIQVGVIEYTDASGMVVLGGANAWLCMTDNGREILVLEGGTNDEDGFARNFWQLRVLLEETISQTLRGVAAHILGGQLPGHYVSIGRFDYSEGESEEPLHATINQRMDMPELTWNHLRNAEWGGFKLDFKLG